MDFRIALRISSAKSRVAWKLCVGDSQIVLKRLEALGPTARVREVATAFGWSKPTIMKFVRLGLLRRKRRSRRNSLRCAFEIEVESARRLVGLCVRTLHRGPPLNPRENSRIRARFEALGPNGDFHALPPQLSVAELARFLRCAPITVRRMVENGNLYGRRRTRHRWEFPKRHLPWWCREKN